MVNVPDGYRPDDGDKPVKSKNSAVSPLGLCLA